jgi:hypothetical protein
VDLAQCMQNMFACLIICKSLFLHRVNTVWY